MYISLSLSLSLSPSVHLQVDSLLFQPLRRTASMTIEAMKSTATITSQPAVANGSPRASPQLRKQTSDVKPPPEEVRKDGAKWVAIRIKVNHSKAWSDGNFVTILTEAPLVMLTAYQI